MVTLRQVILGAVVVFVVGFVEVVELGLVVEFVAVGVVVLVVEFEHTS